MMIKKQKELKFSKNPYTDEYGAGRPKLIYSELGYTIQYTNKDGEMQVLTHLGWRPETSFNLYDRDAGMQKFKELRAKGGDMHQAVRDHMSEIQKPLVVTYRFKEYLKENILKHELKRQAEQENAAQKNDVAPTKSHVKEKTPTLTFNVANAANDTPAAKPKLSNVQHNKDHGVEVPTYEERMSAFTDEENSRKQLGDIFSFAALGKAFKGWSFSDMWNNLFADKKDEQSKDNNNKLEM